jgi:hypothetical protein
MSNQTSVFEKFVKAIDVRSFCTPFGPPLDANWSATDASIELTEAATTYDLFDRPSLVMANGKAVGIVWVEDIGRDETVGGCAEHIVPAQLIAGDTKYFDAFQSLVGVTAYYRYVVDGCDIVGVLRKRDLFGPVGQLCFLALTLEIEAAALALCHGQPQLFDALSSERQQMAEQQFKKRFSDMQP